MLEIVILAGFSAVALIAAANARTAAVEESVWRQIEIDIREERGS